MQLHSQVNITVNDDLLSPHIMGKLRTIQIELQKSIENTVDTVFKSHGICNKAVTPVVVEDIEIENEGDYI